MYTNYVSKAEVYERLVELIKKKNVITEEDVYETILNADGFDILIGKKETEFKTKDGTLSIFDATYFKFKKENL